mgnify:CR=1 FL=1
MRGAGTWSQLIQLAQAKSLYELEGKCCIKNDNSDVLCMSFIKYKIKQLLAVLAGFSFYYHL